jgi:NAD(P)-dependent dehydrogenase (short-subunit alcohol dehydrogenase family)
MTIEKIAVVTGSSSGFGLQTVIELALAGYRVVATMRDLERRVRLEEAAKKAGVFGQIDMRQLDITQFDSLNDAVQGIVRDFGRIDVLVNNAGFATAGFVEDMTLNELRQQFETNFFGNVAMTKAVLPVMRAQKSGHIINISSVGGRVANPSLSAYCGSKFALEGFTESLRIETHSLGIRVTLVEPGSFDTDIWERNLSLTKQSQDSSSPNAERTNRFSQFIKDNAKHRADPRKVAILIVKIAKNPNPKLHYLVGQDARLMVWMKNILPWRTYERLIAKFVKID